MQVGEHDGEKRDMTTRGLSFRTAIVERAFLYWSSKCKADRPPSRADIRPEEIPQLLPHVFLVDVTQASLDFRFRVVGTGICELAGRDYTNAGVNAQEYGPHWKSVFEVYWRVIYTATPEVAVRRAPWLTREFLRYERLIAPLSTDGATVDMLFGALHQVTE
jgi:hypothetical protein